MSQRKCAYLTMEDPTGFFIYDYLTYEPLAELGWRVEEIPWNRAGVRWHDYDVVVIRSPWDYQQSPADFLRVLEQIAASSARLENPLPIVRWNLEKTYLRDLQERGVSIVPTVWLQQLDERALPQLHRQFRAEEIIVKPVIGANADDTFRLTASAPRESIETVRETFRERPCLVQPFLQSIVDEGEYSLFFFGGKYSHCVRKEPKPGDFRVQEEHGGQIRAEVASADLIAAGQRVLEAVPQELLYARVDLVRDPAGKPLLMELELIEPSLYFPYDGESPKRFAQALHGRHQDSVHA